MTMPIDVSIVSAEQRPPALAQRFGAGSPHGGLALPNQLVIAAMVVAITACVSACSSAERECFEDVEAAVARAQVLDPRASPNAAMSAYQDVVDAALRYLDQYPGGGYASDVRSKQERFAGELRLMREETSEYQKDLKKELNEAETQLPSDCQRMAKMWDEFAVKFPRSKFAESAHQKKTRWESKLQEEIARGFQIVIEEARVRPVKGPSHSWMEGHTWDPEMFGASAAPDPYALLLINGRVEGYTQAVKDSFHPAWQQQRTVVHANDEDDLTVAVRDRDVAEKASILLMGKDLLTFSGMAAASKALNEDHDDDICRWTGTLRELMEKRTAGLGRVGDCEQLRVSVTRPR
jgi:Skp family chaperone for outer membrane proteins